MRDKSDDFYIREAIAAEQLAAEWEAEYEQAEAIAEALEAEELAAELTEELDELTAELGIVPGQLDVEDAWLALAWQRDEPLALAYTERWHAAWDWAHKVLEWDDPGEWPESHPRVTRIRAQIVREMDNEEEAFEKAIDVAYIDDWLSMAGAPGRDAGGRRRVIISIHTWLIDEENEVAFKPEWIRYGDDMSCKAAAAETLRLAHEYAQGLAKGTASKTMRMTAIEIQIWTAVEETAYV